jgi:tetratricopeptide (TPR) repeat protein
MYLPLAALVALVLVGAHAALEKLTGRLARRLDVVLVCVLVVVLAVGSARRLAVYQDELTLWQDAFANEPENPLININLGVQLNQAGRPDEGLRHLLRAVEVAPDSYLGHYNLARTYESLGRTDDAIDEYERTLRAKSDHAPARNNLGRILSERGRYVEALDHFEQALHFQPEFSAAHNNLGTALIRLGDLPRAILHFEEALRLQPTIEGYTNLATAYALSGRSSEAIATAEKGASLARSQDQTAFARQIEEAIEAFRRPSAPQP